MRLGHISFLLSLWTLHVSYVAAAPVVEQNATELSEDIAADSCPDGPGDRNGAALAKRQGVSAGIADGSSRLNFWELNTQQQNALLANAKAKGKRKEAIMLSYVNRHVSRLVETRSDQDERFAQYYEEDLDEVGSDVNYADNYEGQAGHMLSLAGVETTFERGWDRAGVISKAGPEERHHTMMSIGYNKAEHILLSARSFKCYDYNIQSQRAYFSTLTWNVWKQEMGPEEARKLRYQMRFDISNMNTNNILALAHMYLSEPGTIDDIPDRAEDYMGASNINLLGHGKWTPDNKAWPYLLGSVNMQTTMDMVTDYNDQMDRPHIVALHTFPLTLFGPWPNLPDEFKRSGNIIIEYSDKPFVSSRNIGAGDGEAQASPDTVETKRPKTLPGLPR